MVGIFMLSQYFMNAGKDHLDIYRTRGFSLDNAFFRSLDNKMLKKDGKEGDEDVFRKFGASTTWIGKLLYRLDAGRNGRCLVLAIGITPGCVSQKVICWFFCRIMYSGGILQRAAVFAACSV